VVVRRNAQDPTSPVATQSNRSRGDDVGGATRFRGRADRDSAEGVVARVHGHDAQVERPATVLNSIMSITRAGGSLGIPGLYVTDDPGAVDPDAKIGMLGIRIGLDWAKSHSLHTGQCPVMKYNRALMMAILHDKIQIGKAVNLTTISLDEAVKGYKDFDKGAAKKFVIDPHGMIAV